MNTKRAEAVSLRSSPIGADEKEPASSEGAERRVLSASAAGYAAPLKKRGAGQTLKDFEEMMERLKPYLPPTIIRQPKRPGPWKLSDELLREPKRHNDSNSPTPRS